MFATFFPVLAQTLGCGQEIQQQADMQVSTGHVKHAHELSADGHRYFMKPSWLVCAAVGCCLVQPSLAPLCSCPQPQPAYLLRLRGKPPQHWGMRS